MLVCQNCKRDLARDELVIKLFASNEVTRIYCDVLCLGVGEQLDIQLGTAREPRRNHRPQSVR